MAGFQQTDRPKWNDSEWTEATTENMMRNMIAAYRAPSPMGGRDEREQLKRIGDLLCSMVEITLLREMR